MAKKRPLHPYSKHHHKRKLCCKKYDARSEALQSAAAREGLQWKARKAAEREEVRTQGISMQEEPPPLRTWNGKPDPLRLAWGHALIPVITLDNTTIKQLSL